MLTTPSTLANRRQLKRHRLSSEIHITDQHMNRPIGKLVDIHQKGLLLLGSSFQLGSTHQISVNLPANVNLQRQFSLGVECLWCQPENDEDTLFWTGCSIIDKSEIASGCIESLINLQST